MNPKEFEILLTKNNITTEHLEKAKISLEDVKLIYDDYTKNSSLLNDAAEFLAKILQKCTHVHSVRWRIKDPIHLIDKIIRKRIENSDKYLKINIENYTDTITDLVGVRVLHLFKHDWLNIHKFITENWEPLERVCAYIREGDQGDILNKYKDFDCEIKNHLAGYRSVHYIISTQLTIKKITSEIQVRTIFEEGWSEIDHKIRYPNFSDDKLICYFLTIFNRLAGNADEMGTFINDLSAQINNQNKMNFEIQAKQEKNITDIENLLEKLNNEKEKNEIKSKELVELSKQIRELRESTLHVNSIIGNGSMYIGGLVGNTSNISEISIDGLIGNAYTIGAAVSNMSNNAGISLINLEPNSHSSGFLCCDNVNGINFSSITSSPINSVTISSSAATDDDDAVN